jgi:hypothetical protein
VAPFSLEIRTFYQVHEELDYVLQPSCGLHQSVYPEDANKVCHESLMNFCFRKAVVLDLNVCCK